MRILGLDKLQKTLRNLDAAAGSPRCSVVTGYRGVNYALYVHENLEAAHGKDFNAKYAAQIKAGSMRNRGPNQKARFLIDPAIALENTIQRNVRADVSRGMTLEDALKRAALLIQRQSMQQVPVDTGNLRGSAFTEVE